MENSAVNDVPRKKSPRAPSMALDEAVERALKIYDKERRHAAPVDVAAQHLGYKTANNGAALSAIASLRYYGLVDRPEQGKLAVVKDLESYQFAPSDELRAELLERWLKSPPIFAELLEKYADGLPSDGNLRFDLIQRGFSPVAAESLIAVFKRSVEFARYFEKRRREPEPSSVNDAADSLLSAESVAAAAPANTVMPVAVPAATNEPVPSDVDRIPVRLAGGRRAWLEIPTPFYAADKQRLKNQIDLLLTEEDESNEDPLIR